MQFMSYDAINIRYMEEILIRDLYLEVKVIFMSRSFVIKISNMAYNDTESHRRG